MLRQRKTSLLCKYVMFSVGANCKKIQTFIDKNFFNYVLFFKNISSLLFLYISI